MDSEAWRLLASEFLLLGVWVTEPWRDKELFLTPASGMLGSEAGLKKVGAPELAVTSPGLKNVGGEVTAGVTGSTAASIGGWSWLSRTGGGPRSATEAGSW